MEGRQSDLQDKWALVTSPSSGFGNDFAHLLWPRAAPTSCWWRGAVSR